MSQTDPVIFNPAKPEVIVAGGICIDVLPTFSDEEKPIEQMLAPGHMTYTGPMLAATGGAVSNTGQALHRLGVPVRLMGKVGGDLWGDAVMTVVSALDASLTEGLIRAPSEAGSYTIVFSSPGTDRFFLHYAGPNDTLCAADIDLAQVAGARFFHFGYPPIMRRFYEDGGAELERLLADVRELGVITSLDMTYPDAASDAGRVDWRAWLARVLPHVDLFLPSIDELLYFLRPESVGGQPPLSATLLRTLSDELLAMGTAVVLIKLGEEGLYLRTTADHQRLAQVVNGAPADAMLWLGRELYAPAFRVWVQGTTGAGDCAIAGFIAAILHGMPPEQAIVAAASSGAASVERTDATSGVPDWDALQARIANGWETRASTIDMAGWTGDHAGVRRSAHDSKSQ